MASALCNRVSLRAPAKVAAARPSRATRLVTKATVDPYLAVSASTAIMLAVGRFAFLPQQRRDLERSAAVSGPKTTGSTYFDNLQQEASFITTTNDPAGFTIIDTLAWGALGHALGFAILASVSSGVIPGVTGQ
jgi:photosystem I subunit V